jgi:hypothetical protein
MAGKPGKGNRGRPKGSGLAAIVGRPVDPKLPNKATINTALRLGAIGTPLPQGPTEVKKKKFRELLHNSFTEEEWVSNFLKLCPEDQFKYRIALEPKEQHVSGEDGGPLEVSIIRFSEDEAE